MRKIILLIIALLALLVLATGWALAASPNLADIAIDWWAAGPGSSTLLQGTTELHGMVGQGFAGQASQAESEVCSGFLCLPLRLMREIFLPLIVR